MIITISDYKNLTRRCLKKVWIDRYNKSVLQNKSNERLEEIILIKELGRKLIDNGTLINHSNNIEIMIEQTKDAINNNKILYNSTFKCDDIYIKCDIIESNNNKLDIYLIGYVLN